MQNSEHRLLVFSYYFPPLGMGGVQRISKFIKYMPQFHWHPEAITVKPIRYYAVDTTMLQETGRCLVHRTGSLDPNRISFLIFRKKTSPSSGAAVSEGFPAFLKRIMDKTAIPDAKIGWVPFAAVKGYHLLKNGGFSAILTTSPPLSGHIPGLLLARRLHIPWVADFRDHWLPELSFADSSGIKRTARRYLAGKIVEAANAVTAVSDPIRTSLASLSRTAADRIVTIPNGFDPDDFQGGAATKHERFTITYCGTMSTLLNPEPFFKALAEAVRRRPDMENRISVRLVGKATDIDPKKIIKRWGAERCTTLCGYVTHAEAVSEMITSDLLLFLLPDTCSKGMATGKIYEYVASGRPILAFSGECEASRILIHHPACTIVTSRQTGVAAETIIRWFDAWDRGGGAAKGPFSYPDIHHFDRREQTRTLSGILDDLV